MRAAWHFSAVAMLAIAASSVRAQTVPTANRFHFAQHDVVSFGTNEGGFTNATIGARIDYAVMPALRVGLEIAYANLEADPERAHSVLALAQLEARATLSERWSVPARIALGHLASNGPVLRLAGGIAFKLASRLEVVLEVAPTFFTTRDGVYPAIGPGLELSFRL
jgi:hypothetical protein